MNSQIYGDGKTCWFFFKDDQGEMCYEITNYEITDINIHFGNLVEETIPLQGKNILFPKTGDITFNTSIRLPPKDKKGKPTLNQYISKTGGLIPKIGIFKNFTVAQLFKVINIKINKRIKK